MEIAASAGQTILFSGRFSVLSFSPAARSSNGETTDAKKHADTGMITYLSIIGKEALALPNSTECIEALDILALHRHPRWVSTNPQWVSTNPQDAGAAALPASTLARLELLSKLGTFRE